MFRIPQNSKIYLHVLRLAVQGTSAWFIQTSQPPLVTWRRSSCWIWTGAVGWTRSVCWNFLVHNNFIKIFIWLFIKWNNVQSRVNPLWTAQLNNWCMCQCIKRMMKRKSSYSATIWGIRTFTLYSGVQWNIFEHKLPKHSTEILHICTGRKGVVTSPWTKIGVVRSV